MIKESASSQENEMPDIGFAALAVIGAVVLAGGGGWLFGLVKGRRSKNDD